MTVLYDVTADGQRFVAVQNAENRSDAMITIVQNWIKEFDKQE